MFALDSFIADCLSAAAHAEAAARAVHDLMKRAFSDASAVVRALGEPTESGLVPLYRSDALTIVNVVWKPGMTVAPHNHQTWAVIGVYCGREDNVFWRRKKDAPQGQIEVASQKTLSPGDVMPLGKDIIHSVTNPVAQLTGAIHVYGGDFFALARSEWDADTLVERPYDMAKTRALFES